MRSSTAAFAAAGAIGLTVVAGTAVAAPLLGIPTVQQLLAGDDADDTSGEDAPDDVGEEDAPSGTVERAKDRIADALSDLVADGTITQSQADAVASTLAERGAAAGRNDRPGRGETGHWGRGHHAGLFDDAVDAAAEALGISKEDVRQAMRDGTTLAELAAQHGVDTGALVDALVQEATEHLQERVDARRLSQEQADERVADLRNRVIDLLDRTWTGPGTSRSGEAEGDA